MAISLPLNDDQKITITFRVEPGSLGPTGKDHIEAYCDKAQQHFKTVDADFVHWQIIPRYDKSLPELQYSLINKTLNSSQAEKYLNLFGKCINEFEEHLEENISQLIEDFLDR